MIWTCCCLVSYKKRKDSSPIMFRSSGSKSSYIFCEIFRWQLIFFQIIFNKWICLYIIHIHIPTLHEPFHFYILVFCLNHIWKSKQSLFKQLFSSWLSTIQKRLFYIIPNLFNHIVIGRALYIENYHNSFQIKLCAISHF